MEKFRPRIILNAAITVDGKIATKNGDSALSSKFDKKRIHKLRSKVDAILIGSNTLRIDDPQLTVRYVKGKNPIRVILDSNGTISSKSKILQTCSKVPTIIVTTKKISLKNITRLKKFPIELIIFRSEKINIKKLMKLLVQRNIRTLLVEGGGTVNWEFFRNNLVDKLIITISPFVVGGKDAITLVEGKGFSKISKSKKLRLDRIFRNKNEVVMEYSTSKLL